MSEGARGGPVQSVDRAVSVLQVLAREGECRVTEVAALVGLHKSSAFRLLATLEARGLVEQTAERGRYRLGHGVVQLAAGVTRARHQDVAAAGHEACADLAAELGETVNIAVLDAGSAVCVDQVSGSRALSSVNWVGQREPLHATSTGQVLLAGLAPARRLAVAGELEPLTAATITEPAALSERLTAVERAGWAMCREEFEVGLVAVAAPVRTMDGDVVAALSAAGPTTRLDDAALPGVVERVQTAAAAVSRRLGYVAPPSPGT